jgi:aspartate/glutamate racemase
MANVSCDEWVENVIQREQIFENKDCVSCLIRLSIPLTLVAYYRALQIKISSLIPNESCRPTIWLDVLGELATAETALSAAIIGGMGPVSDSSLLVLAAEKLGRKGSDTTDYKLCRIQVLSIPPPRSLSRAIVCGWSYLSKIRTFLGQCQGCPVFLASNTAHVYHSTFNYLSDCQTVNLCENVSDKVARICSATDDDTALEKPNGVLILGTSLARSGQLYDTLLAARNTPFCYVSMQHQEAIQRTIDCIKSGRGEGAGGAGVGGSALDIVEEVVRSHNSPPDSSINVSQEESPSLRVRVILLGCTELPLAFVSKSGDNDSGEEKKSGDTSTSPTMMVCEEGARRLRELAAAHDVQVVDTEDVFAETIAEYIGIRLDHIKRSYSNMK